MRGLWLGILLAGIAPASAQPAGHAGPQSVDTGLHRFKVTRHVLKADGKTLFDMGWIASGQRAPDAFSIRILSAVGPVVSVQVRSRSCNDETCRTRTEVEAWRGEGGEASLPPLLADGSLLASLRRDPTLAGLLSRPENRDAKRRFDRAGTTKEMADLLVFTGLKGPAGEVGLPSVRYDSFVLDDYDADGNVLRLSLHMETRGATGPRPGPVLPLTVTPTPAFARHLAEAKRNDKGLLAAGRAPTSDAAGAR